MAHPVFNAHTLITEVGEGCPGLFRGAPAAGRCAEVSSIQVNAIGPNKSSESNSLGCTALQWIALAKCNAGHAHVTPMPHAHARSQSQSRLISNQLPSNPTLPSPIDHQPNPGNAMQCNATKMYVKQIPFRPISSHLLPPPPIPSKPSQAKPSQAKPTAVRACGVLHRAVFNGEKKVFRYTVFPKKPTGTPWLMAVGGGWRRLVAVGGGWWLAAVGGWRLVVP